jgi:phosphotransferase system HPr-like phosphotransfer protein
MSQKATIMLSTINDVKDFVSTVSRCDYDVDLISGRYAIDAKSIMGIFSLDLSKPIELEAQTDDASAFFEQIKPYIVTK